MTELELGESTPRKRSSNLNLYKEIANSVQLIKHAIVHLKLMDHGHIAGPFKRRFDKDKIPN